MRDKKEGRAVEGLHVIYVCVSICVSMCVCVCVHQPLKSQTLGGVFCCNA